MPTEPLTSRILIWLDERLPLAGARALLAKKVVPAHDQSVWYLLGGITLLAFGLLIVTGALLVFHYQPGDPGAHASVQRIVEDVPHGWWIRSTHHWSAHLMIAGVLLHLLSTLLMKAYRRPREFTWWTGLLLAGLAMAAAFTGYLLPWTGLSFAATRVGAGMAGAPPLIGPLVQKLLLGGSDVSSATLTRFFGMHVVVLPLLMLAVTGLHLCLVVVHGSSRPPSRGGAPSFAPPLLKGGNTGAAADTPFWPDFALRELRAWLIVIAGLLIVAGFLPPTVGTQADTLAPTPEVRPEWYFLGFYRILKMFPASLLGIDQLRWAVFAGMLVGAGMAALPILDAPPLAGTRPRRRGVWLSFALVGLSAGLGWLLSALAGVALTEIPPVRIVALTAAVWLAVAVLAGWLRRYQAQTPATLFGCVLVAGMVMYLGWEAFSERVALWALVVTCGCLGLIALRGVAGRITASLAVIAALLAVIPLGAELFSSHESAGGATVFHGRVPLHRIHETAPVLVVAVGLLALLLVLIQLRIRHQDKLRAMGLRPAAEHPHR